MHVFLSRPILMIILNGLCTIALMSAATAANNNKKNNHVDPLVLNLQHLVDTALPSDASDDVNNELLIEQLSRILEQEEGFRLNDRHARSIYPVGEEETQVYDGSGDVTDGVQSPLSYSNVTLVTFTMGSTTTAFSKYTPQAYPPCPCEKGERGEKGDMGICPADCGRKFDTDTKECLGSRVNLERLAQSVGRLILEAKKIASRNAQATSCVCPTLPPPTTAVTTPFTLDYNTYMRLKGEKGDRGDTGTSCSPTCGQSAQMNVRVFSTLQQAVIASSTYPDQTYVHIVDDYGRLIGVYIRSRNQLIPVRLGNEPFVVPESTQPSTTISIPASQCRTTLPCSTLRMFALGPYIRRMCNSNRGATNCSRLADYDNLCANVAYREQLRGSYRAFMSTSTQWLSHLFAGICVHAKIVNMNEQVLFDAVGDIFEQRSPQSEILDVRGSKPEFRYFWHGTAQNGTASKDTCNDWSRQDASLSGSANLLPDGSNGLFHHPSSLPCSIDLNMGILCIETNCDRNNKPYQN